MLKQVVKLRLKVGANVVLTATNSISNRLQNLTAGSLNVEKELS